MKKVLVWLGCFIPTVLFADHLQIREPVKLIAIEGQIAELEVSVSWENSWRNESNYDAVYLFGKYRTAEDSVWRHMDWAAEGHHVEEGPYDFLNTGKGMFFYRAVEGQGGAEFKARIKWNLAGDPDHILTSDLFQAGKVLYEIQGIEMVYVPTAPFYAGDGSSEKSFNSYTFGSIPPEYDIIGTNGNFTYSASANANQVTHPADRQNHAVHDANYDWTPVVPAWWRVDFKSPREIRYFGVSGEYFRPGIPARSVPTGEWYFEGSNDATNWVELWKGGEEYWSTSQTSYPVQKAIQIEHPQAFRYYQIRIPSVERVDFWNTVHVNNVAMTEKDLSEFETGPVLVDGFQYNLPSTFPTGYEGFYTMKYEVTQEQYVAFLNKLTVFQQRLRTCGSRLDKLREREYIFGENLNVSDSRNGIIVVKCSEGQGQPWVFGCDLNPENIPNSADDGQTIACNFLSPEDLLAYADWTGLRPLSELEYEKMAKPPYPYIPQGREAAGNEAVQTGKKLQDPGLVTEYLGTGNINAGNQIGAPVRSSAFVKANQSRQDEGVSYWGVGDLSGNLSEIYYNAGVYGRQLNKNVHGNGMLNLQGRTDIAPTSWTTDLQAFGLRGGSYASASTQVAVADRQEAEGAFISVGERKGYVGFRLGYSAPQETGEVLSVLELENGKKSGAAMVYDTVCNAAEYRICGNVPSIREPYFFTWYESRDQGKIWKKLEGETKADLVLYDLIANVPFGQATEFRYKRYTSGPERTDVSGIVALTIGHGLTVNRLQDTLIPCRDIGGFVVNTPLPARFTWTLLDFDRVLTPTTTTATSSSFKAVTSDLKKNEKWPSGDYTVEIVTENQSKGCLSSQSLNIYAHPMTIDPFEGISESYMFQGNNYILAHRWTGNDPQVWKVVQDDCDRVIIDPQTGAVTYNANTNAWDYVECYFTASLTCRDVPDRTYTKRAKYLCRSCKDYYDSGMRQDGNYLIDPDGPGGLAPYTAYCDMKNGGWTLFTQVSNGWHGFPGNSANHYKNRVTDYTRFVALASVSSQQKVTAVQGSSESCCDAYYFLNYNNGQVTNLPYGAKGNGNWGDVIVPINKNWQAAMYKTRFTTDGSVNGGAGSYFNQMWFR